MNPIIGWGLAAAAVAAGWTAWGVPGVVLALTVISFWLVLQFSRALRVMRLASSRPVGLVDSAVMLNARLASGMTMMQVLPITRSLGERVGEGGGPGRADDDTWRWRDAGGDSVTLRFNGGKLAGWQLVRAVARTGTEASATGATTPGE